MPASSSSSLQNQNQNEHPPSSNDMDTPQEGGVGGSSSTANSTANSAAAAIDFLTLARGLKTTPRTGWILQEAGSKIESVADHSWRLALMTLLLSSSSSTSTTTTTTTTITTSNGNPDAAAAATTTTTSTTTTTTSSSSNVGSSTTTTMFDPMKCLKMALIHDLAEARVGDITPHCGISNETKHDMERTAMIQLTSSLRRQGLQPEQQQQQQQQDDTSSSPPSSSSSSSLLSLGLDKVGEDILELWKEYEEGTTMEAQVVKDMDKLEMILQALEYEQDDQHQQSLNGFFDSTRDQWKTELGRAWGREIESRRPPAKQFPSSRLTIDENKDNTTATMP
jgi:putative hydrolases of HD superfamily